MRVEKETEAALPTAQLFCSFASSSDSLTDHAPIPYPYSGALQERPSSEAELKKKKNQGPFVVATIPPYLIADGKNGASLEF